MHRAKLTFRPCLFIAIASIAALFLFAIPAFAETRTELEVTIREAILSDPRSAEMTEAEIDALVASLGEEAATQNFSSADITWRPLEGATSEEASQSEEACPYAQVLCALNDAFGFTEFPFLIPLLFAITSAILLFVIGSILLHHHGHHPFAGNLRREG